MDALYAPIDVQLQGTQRLGEKMYEGRLKSFSPKDGYGFIACAALKSMYGRDVYIHKSKVPDGASSGCSLQFTIGLNAKGQPQAQSASLVSQTPDDLAQAAAACRTDLLQFETLESPDASTCHIVVLNKKRGQRLGLDVDADALTIDTVRSGAAEDWNTENPHRRVMPGDRIVQVNHVCGDIRAVLNECKVSQHLEIRLARPVPAPSACLLGLKVTTWNILSGAYATLTAYPDVDPKILPAPRRRAQIAAVLSRLAADVYCLQEVDCSLEELGLGFEYDSVFAQRPRGRVDRCVIAWRRDRLEMGPAGYREVQFDEYAPPPTMFNQQLHADHASGNVGVVVELRMLRDPGRRCITICTTHLCWQPHRVDIRHWQLHTLFSVGQSLGSSRVIVCGDLNALPESPPMRFLSQACRLESVYRDVEHSAVTNSNACSMDGAFAAMIDYIFYAPTWFTLQSRVRLPTPGMLKVSSSVPPEGPVPTLLSASWPSDHLALTAILALNNAPSTMGSDWD
mmetsp:Transcript_70565/g.181929  ORF Transcript_70565/g.181929 Transcript_70565/m.181929 type:complete len:511 (+) Transcript_70565:162-1694(+)|eukprot:CAMPEP_0195099340 /NCGR_PEP_ID=MMETSP0448-20130528/58216_1 /TAXON_ID=66468 /ORGANISM="Heterocapsa triquestra, Strain CCMP 448" /LENGTH=510 /DNA_ID=CAMNT_0040134215 /DNA_START=155 /DNA_END=1687 /DNA_ORIENTATION=+